VLLRSLLALSIPCLLAVTPASAVVPKEKRPRLVVLEFPVNQGAYEGWNGWGYHGGQTSISGALQELMTTALLEKGSERIRLMERKQLEAILAEQKLGASGLADEDTAVKMGKLIGVKYMVTGKVTRFAYKKSGFGSGWGATALLNKLNPSGGAANSVAGDIHVSKATFTGRLDIRLIDVETGEILAVAKDEGEVKDTSVKVAGTGADVQYDQELVNKVFEPVVDRLAETLLKKITRIQAQADND